MHPVPKSYVSSLVWLVGLVLLVLARKNIFASLCNFVSQKFDNEYGAPQLTILAPIPFSLQDAPSGQAVSMLIMLMIHNYMSLFCPA